MSSTRPSNVIQRLAILGAGNIGVALARGLAASGRLAAGEITLARRKSSPLKRLEAEGFRTTTDGTAAVAGADGVVIAVQPSQLHDLFTAAGDAIASERRVVVSLVSDVTMDDVRGALAPDVRVVRAMPNTALAIRESMTCIARNRADPEAVQLAEELFGHVGRTLVIDEEQMTPATALCACGVAFFLRAIRAAAQGGIEIGFHAHEAITIAAQTARGAASLLREESHHPERQIDRVTTPRGCTIAGLNEMEHRGFSSAMIKGIVTSARKAAHLYVRDGEET